MGTSVGFATGMAGLIYELSANGSALREEARESHSEGADGVS